MFIGNTGFGYSPEQPISVGGGIVFGPFNEQQYLLRLRLPGGEPLDFRRIGNLPTERKSSPTILDVYELSSSSMASPVRLFFDVYSPGPDGVPAGFVLDCPESPWSLPTSIVRTFQETDASSVGQEGKRWRIIGAEGQVVGFAEWDGQRSVSLDLTKHIGDLMRGRVDGFIGITPTQYMGPVLSDFFERFLAIESSGLLKGEPMDQRTKTEWKGGVWGTGVQKPKKRPGWLSSIFRSRSDD
jgi:hypothetical protein